MKPKQTNISIFIPHLGCPNICSFCNQHYISAAEKAPSPNEVSGLLEEQNTVLRRSGTQAEIAFFGGSFTAVNRDYMISLLETARFYTEKYPDVYNGIRCSTRPDRIDDSILAILKEYGVTAVELGAQSMDNEVLEANKRGHTADDVVKAAELIRKYVISPGLQMMTGLYRDTPEKCVRTAEKFISLKPDTVRIYPTVILKNTLLDKLKESGEYQTFTFEETVELCAKLITMFENAGISVIRTGLHAEKNIEKQMTGGVYHPAFREICESRIFYNRMKELFSSAGGGKFIVYCDKKYISRIIGHNSCNRNAFLKENIVFKIKEEKGTEIRAERI